MCDDLNYQKALPGVNIEAVFAGKCSFMNFDDLAYVAVEEDTLHCTDDLFSDGFTPEKGSDILPMTAPFEQIAAAMNNVDEKGLVKKELIKAGFGHILHPKSIVLIHYEMFFNGEPKPFDSTIHRKKPMRVHLGEDYVIYGMEIALESMKLQEVSRFMISWKVAFGEFGVLPRIPRKADVLAQIQVLKILDIVVPEIAGEIPESHDSLESVLTKGEKLLQLGKEQYQARSFATSVQTMNNAVNILQNTPVNDEEEQEKLDALLLRVHVNLSGIYNYINKPELACIHCKEALRFNPNHCKALFNFGRALIRLQNFDKAKGILSKGRSLYPKNKDFLDELERLATRKAERDAREKNVEKTENP